MKLPSVTTAKICVAFWMSSIGTAFRKGFDPHFAGHATRRVRPRPTPSGGYTGSQRAAHFR